MRVEKDRVIVGEELLLACCSPQAATVEEIVALDLSGKKISSFNETLMNRLVNLEELNLCKNRLHAFQDTIRLDKLKRLYLQDNEIQNVLFSHQFPALEELDLYGNPVRTPEKMLAVLLLPHLKLLDGKDCSEYREQIVQLKADVVAKVDIIWRKHFSDRLRQMVEEKKPTEQVSRDFVRKLIQEIKCHNNAKTALRYLVDLTVKDKVHDELEKAKTLHLRKFGHLSESASADSSANESKEDNGQDKDDTADDSNLLEITSEKKSKLTKTKERNQSPSKSPRKRKADVEEDIDVEQNGEGSEFEPKLFLRCHCRNNNAFDSLTQIWKATFQPNISGESDSKIVATCGGNIVCLINCETGKVEKRYTDSDAEENFFCLAFTVIKTRVNRKETSEIVLAVAGKQKRVVLLRPDDLICYSKFPAHDKDVNSLLFHPKKVTWLFSAGYDRFIRLWDISLPSLQSNHFVPLLEIDSYNFLLSLVYSVEYDTLLAGGENGLMIWKHVSDDKSESTFGQIDFSEESNIVDGLCLLPDKPDFVAIKRSKTGTISIGSLQEIINEMAKTSVRNKVNSFRQVAFRSYGDLDFCKTKCDYIYMAAQSGLLVCGDDTGSLWVYDTKAIPFVCNEIAELIAAKAVLTWPPINNPKHKQKKVVDETKQVVINAVAIDPKLTYIVAATNVNLVCLWKHSPHDQITDE